MTIIQEALILLTLWVAAAVNMLIVGHITGALLGTLIGKLVNCIVGFDIAFNNETTGVRFTEGFKGWDAWTAQGDIEMLKRYARAKALHDIEGDL